MSNNLTAAQKANRQATKETEPLRRAASKMPATYLDQMFDQLMSRTVGFEYLPTLFDNHQTSFPHYDIYKQDDKTYVVQIALAGYNAEDIDVSQTDWDLMVSCSNHHQQSKNDSDYLHKGIAKRSFTMRLGLGLHTEVTDAVMKDGMLYVTVTQHNQDSNKPIQIRTE